MDYNKAKRVSELIQESEKTKDSIKRILLARQARHIVTLSIPGVDITKQIHEGINDKILEHIEICLNKHSEQIKREIENIE